MLAIAKNDSFTSDLRWGNAETQIASLSAETWRRLSAGMGAKGPRLYDWALRPLALDPDTGFGHALLARRHITLAMWALAFLTVTRAELMADKTKKAAALTSSAASVGG